MEEALANGMDPEDVLLVEYTYSIEQYWYYRYMTPFGDVLQEGRSPYWHKEHNYILNIIRLSMVKSLILLMTLLISKST